MDQNLNPVFNHFEDFFVSNAIQTKLTIEVFDHDKLTEKDEIGVVVLALGDIVPMVRYLLSPDSSLYRNATIRF